MKQYTEGKGAKLALNSVGGRSALRLARCLCPGGVHVTFGAMDASAVRFPTRNLIFDDVRMVGFGWTAGVANKVLLVFATLRNKCFSPWR